MHLYALKFKATENDHENIFYVDDGLLEGVLYNNNGSYENV
jgi:hypothetical protein